MDINTNYRTQKAELKVIGIRYGYEAYDIMLKQGIPSQNLLAEVYF